MDLQAKRADMVAQIEQFVGQINRNNGAIALLDELIAEAAAAKDAAEAAAKAEDWWEPASAAPDPILYTNSPSAAPDWVQGEVLSMPSATPEVES